MKKFLLVTVLSLFLVGCATKVTTVTSTDTDKVKVEKLTKNVEILNTQITQQKKTIKVVKIERNVLAVLFIGLFLFLAKTNAKVNAMVKKVVDSVINLFKKIFKKKS
jgi:PBP1b-binding outer membrane lipoprotein LpoB